MAPCSRYPVPCRSRRVSGRFSSRESPRPVHRQLHGACRLQGSHQDLAPAAKRIRPGTYGRGPLSGLSQALNPDVRDTKRSGAAATGFNVEKRKNSSSNRYRDNPISVVFTENSFMIATHAKQTHSTSPKRELPSRTRKSSGRKS